MAKIVYVGVGYSDAEDAYKAGKEAAKTALEQIKRQKPGIAMIFSSPKYDLTKVLRGVKEVTGATPSIGCTTAIGCISGEGFHKKSVMVGVISSKYMSFGVGVGEEISKDPVKAGRKAAANALKTLKFNPYKAAPKKAAEQVKFKPYCLIMIPDALSAPNELVLQGVAEIAGGAPVIGGSAADELEFKKTYQFCNGKLYSDSVVCAAIAGNVKIGTGIKNGYSPITEKNAFVTKAEPRIIHELDGKPAADVFAEMLGVDLEKLRKEALGLTITNPLTVPDASGTYLWPKHTVAISDKKIVNAAPVAENTAVVLGQATKESHLKAAREATREALESAGNPEDIAVVFTPHCTGRAVGLGDDAPKILDEIKAVVGKDVPIFGFNTYGEQGSPKGCALGHHTLTMPVLLISNELY
ncbi:FIST C-terminal domain-containing protein [Candidatus Bathyarchaeota archaeon]|nr:FIST C-terminal domain-containing protein [Candidatus Bathyarchaeota archaeon]